MATRTFRFYSVLWCCCGRRFFAWSMVALLTVLINSHAAMAAEPKVVLSISSGGGTTICDTNCTVCTVVSGECLVVVEEDLILCRPTSSGLPITACDWEMFFDGDAAGIQLSTQMRAVEVAANGNLVFVALTDRTLPGIGQILKTDIGLFQPLDVLQPYVGGGPYTEGSFKLYLNGNLTQQDETTKPWDAIEVIPDGVCENAITIDPLAHTCPIIGSLTAGSGTAGLGGIHFRNEDLLRCIPTAFNANGTVEACSYSLFLDANNINADTEGQNQGITSDIEAIELLSFDADALSGQMVFKKGSGNPPGFPAHTPSRDLLLYDGTFGAGMCDPSGEPCAGDSDCPSGESCDTGSCTISATPCATDQDCSGSGNACASTRFPVGSVTLYFDGNAVGLSGAGQKIEAFSVIPDTDGDDIPDGVDNCPGLDNPPSVCDGGVALCPSGLSSECPVSEICVQPDSDGDLVGDPCDQCNGRDDAVCACGDGILDVPSEQCDLAAFNRPGDPDSPCSQDCQVIGSCSVSGSTCTVADDCTAPDEGCCGNGIVEGLPASGGEECDDGNTIDDDLCTNACLDNTSGAQLPPECAVLFGPNVVQAFVKPMKMSDTSRVAGTDFDKWGIKGNFNLVDGVTFDPDSQVASLIFSQESVIFQATLQPSSFIQGGPAFDKPKWKFKDKEGDIVGAESWTNGKLSLKSSRAKVPFQQAKYNLKGRGDRVAPQVSFPVDPAGLGGSAPNNIRLRASIVVGTTCATRIVTCEQKGGGKVLKCASIFVP